MFVLVMGVTLLEQQRNENDDRVQFRETRSTSQWSIASATKPTAKMRELWCQASNTQLTMTVFSVLDSDHW